MNVFTFIDREPSHVTMNGKDHEQVCKDPKKNSLAKACMCVCVKKKIENLIQSVTALSNNHNFPSSLLMTDY